jgi:hypothetical protein
MEYRALAHNLSIIHAQIMKPYLQKLFIALTSLAILSSQLSSLRAQSTAFTYQGRVMDNGTNFSGAGQFKFALVTSTNAIPPRPPRMLPAAASSLAMSSLPAAVVMLPRRQSRFLAAAVRARRRMPFSRAGR